MKQISEMERANIIRRIVYGLFLTRPYVAPCAKEDFNAEWEAVARDVAHLLGKDDRVEAIRKEAEMTIVACHSEAERQDLFDNIREGRYPLHPRVAAARSHHPAAQDENIPELSELTCALATSAS